MTRAVHMRVMNHVRGLAEEGLEVDVGRSGETPMD